MKRGVLFALRTFLVLFFAGIFLFPAFSPVMSSGEELPAVIGRDQAIEIEIVDGEFTVEKEFHYELPELVPAEYVDSYDVWVPGLNHYSVVGQPWMPVEGVSVALPPNMLPRTVSAEYIGEPIVIELDKDVSPSPEPVPVSKTYEEMYGDQSDPTKYFCKGDAYQKDELYPGRSFEYETSFGLSPKAGPSRDTIILTSGLRAQYVDVKLFPVQYNPVHNTLQFYSGIRLKVTYDANPDYSGAMRTRAESYDMVIITPRSFVGTFQTLADYRNSTGILTKVVAKEDIYSGKYFTVSGVDNPERIKYFLKDALETWGIEFVILAGDSGQMPIRYIKIDNGNFANVPSDLYYSDIYKSGGVFADWQVDGDSLWGEWTSDVSDVDLRPDLTLGRLPCASISEASNMITKIQNYETYAYGASWFKEITLMGLDTFSGGVAEGEYYSNYLVNNYYTTARGWNNHKLYASLGNCNSATLLQTQNHHVGIMTFSDHGLETSWANKVSVNNVNQFSNGNKLPIVTVDACLTGAIDTSNAFAESFIKKSTGGGIASLGSSRISLGIVGSNHIHGVSGFYNRMFHYSYTEQKVKQVGGMYLGAQNLYYQYQSPKSQMGDYLVLTEYILFGDPTVSIGGFPKTNGKISCDDNAKNLNPGQEVLYNMSIENTGTGEAYVTFLVTKADGSPIPPEWEWGLSQLELTLSPSMNVTVFLNVTAPADAVANEVMDIKFQALSPNIEEAPLVVTTYSTVNRVFDFDFGCDDNEHTIDAEQGTTYLLCLDNLGNDDFLFDLTVTGTPEEWTVQLSNTTINLGIDDTKLVQLYVKPDAATISATYNFKVRCGFRDKPTVYIEQFITTSVNPSHGFYLRAKGDPEMDVDPGAVVEYEMEIENTGNHDDLVTVTFPNKNQLNGWLVKSQSGVNIDIAAFATEVIIVEATIPNDALAGPVNIEVEGKLASDSSTRVVTLVANVEPQYLFDLSSDKTVQIGESGAQVPFTISVANSGNVQDTYDLNIKNQPEDWTITLSSSMSLEPFSSDSTNMVVTLPEEDIKAEAYNITIEAQSRTSGIVDLLYLIVDIPVQLGVDLEPDTDWLEVSPGETGKFYIDIKNTGNTPDDYKVTHSSITSWDIKLSKELVSIDEFDGDTLILEALPSENAYMGQYGITIKGVSKTDGSIEDSVDLVVYTKQTYKLELISDVLEASIKDEGEVEFEYKLTNMGNGKDKFTAAFDGLPPGWVVTTDSEVELDSGQTHTGRIKIEIPDDKSEEKTYDIKLIVTSKGTADASGEVDYTVAVEKSAIGGLGNINPFGTDSKGSSSSTIWLFIILFIIILVGILLIVLVVAVKRRGKKNKKKQAALPPQQTQAQPVPRQQAQAARRPAQQQTRPQTGYYKSSTPEYKQAGNTVQSTKQESMAVYAAPTPPPARNVPAPPPKPPESAGASASPDPEPAQVEAAPPEPVIEAAPKQEALPPAAPAAEEPPQDVEEPVIEMDDDAGSAGPEASGGDWDDAFDLDMDEDDEVEEF